MLQVLAEELEQTRAEVLQLREEIAVLRTLVARRVEGLPYRGVTST